MPRYLSLHALGCLPKPAFAALCRILFATADGARRVVAGQIGEKMLVEFDATDRAAADEWLRTHKLNAIWVVRLDYESTNGDIAEL